MNPNGKTAYVPDGYSVIPVSLTQHRALAPIAGFDAPVHDCSEPEWTVRLRDELVLLGQISTGDCIPTPKSPVVEPNGKIQLYVGGQFVDVVNLRTNKIVGRIDVGRSSQPTGIAVSLTGAKLYVTFGQFGQRGTQVAVIDTRTDRVEAHLSDGAPLGRNEGADQIAVTPSGSEAFLSLSPW